ncbi:Fur family transcriptional regulator [Dactylosporangium sp. CA-092794]|uniref:Fur family transcriptional regulator n=1 Tax=Dactylosporangium sp. CA-092794 TaxID=3239929 RepID=UPI003D8F5A9E
MRGTDVRPDDRQRVDRIRDQVRAGGRRWTVAKGAIVDVLLDRDGHLSTQEIHEAVAARYPQVDRSTIHRVLLALADEGLVHVLGQHGEARYGLADRPHHHAVCAGCGRVAEIPAEVMRRLIDTAGDAVGYRFDAGSLTLTGRCGRCG